MAAPTPKTRRTWTDDEKRELIAAFEKAPPGDRVQWLKDHDVHPQWFYNMRKRLGKPKKDRLSPEGRAKLSASMKQRHADAKKVGTTLKGNAGVKEINWPQFVAEYDALPHGGRAEWAKKRGVKVALIGYHRKRLKNLKQQPQEYKKPPLDDSSLAALFAEYESLSRGGARGEWLADHGLYKSWPQFARNKLKANGNGHGIISSLPAVRMAPINPPQPHILPSAAPGPVVTLDDAINALQVRQDIWNEFVGLLKAMRAGTR